MERKSHPSGQPATPIESWQLWLPPNVVYNILEHVQNALPFEGGGVLLGQKETKKQLLSFVSVFHAHCFVPIDNVEKSTTRYFSAPSQTVMAVLEANKRGVSLVATVHSHPNSVPVASRFDIQEAFSYAIPHLIVGHVSTTPLFQAYRYQPTRKADEVFPVDILLL